MNEGPTHFEVNCPHCNVTSEVPAEWAGKKIKCKSCSRSFQFQIPVPEDEVPEVEIEEDADAAASLPVIDHSGHRLRQTWKRAVRRQFLPSTSVFDIFDFSFRKYITPWVVRVTWGAALYMAVAYLLVMGLFAIGRALEPDVRQAKLPVQAAAKRDGGNQFNPQQFQNPFNMADPEEAKPNPPAQHNEQPNVQFKLPQELQESALAKITSVLILTVQCLGVVIGLLWVRVALEGVIVLFNISMTLNSIDEAVNRTAN